MGLPFPRTRLYVHNEVIKFRRPFMADWFSTHGFSVSNLVVLYCNEWKCFSIEYDHMAFSSDQIRLFLLISNM